MRGRGRILLVRVPLDRVPLDRVPLDLSPHMPLQTFNDICPVTCLPVKRHFT